MNPETRQKLMLVALAVVLAFAGFRYLGGWLGSTAAGQALGLQRPKRVDVEALLSTQVAELHTDRLAGQSGELTPGRDPWRYGPAEKSIRGATRTGPAAPATARGAPAARWGGDTGQAAAARGRPRAARHVWASAAQDRGVLGGGDGDQRAGR